MAIFDSGLLRVCRVKTIAFRGGVGLRPPAGTEFTREPEGCSPFCPAIHRGQKGNAIFHIKSQANDVSLREILFLAVILHSN
jgi:hypothetical protein